MPGPYIPDPTPDWLKPENASVTDSALTKAMRMIGHLIGADNPTAQVFGLMMTDVPGGSATGGLAKAVEGLKARVIKAYHGSPHDFERFSLEKIGTGEGAQAYGHGLYFAEREATAKAYRDQLSGQSAQLTRQYYGQPLNETDRIATAALLRNSDPSQAKFVAMNWTIPKEIDREQVYRAIDRIAKETPKAEGKMYEVAIHADPEDFLDWDKPLSQQSEKVKQALLAQPEVRDMIEKQSRVLGKPVDPSGRGAYAAMSQWHQGVDLSPEATKAAAASAKLKEAGIPGIKYFDQGSRAAGEGSRNYVINDERLVEVLKKYGLLLPATGLATKDNKKAVSW